MALTRDLPGAVLPGPRIARRIQQAFDAEEIDGIRLATRGRIVALGAVALLLPFISPYPSVLYFEALLLVFLTIGICQYMLAKSRYARRWHPYLFAALDAALMGFTLTVPSPFTEFPFASQISVRGSVFIYYFMLLAVIAFSYRPRLMLWGGCVGALSWSLATLRIALLDDSTTVPLGFGTMQETLAAFADPSTLFLRSRLQEIVVLIVVAWILATVMLRTRRLAERQITAERERANLARYFSPNIVDEIAQRDRPFGSVRELPVAVLFADIVGFTKLAESQTPGEMIELLRGYHQRVEQAVFRHGGTLDKFLGDGAMATFGTPETGAHDAFDALACARDILRSIDDWNRVRRAGDGDPLCVSIGLHYGPVVIGDLGSERRLELAVLGDTVNVASRLEHVTRDLGCRMVVSDHLLQAARARRRDLGEAAFAGIDHRQTLTVRGRSEAIPVWSLAEG